MTVNSAFTTLHLSIQRMVRNQSIPPRKKFINWIKQVLGGENIAKAEICIRLVDEDESAFLNQNYRGKVGATNILSFSFEPSAESNITLMGDLAICVPLVEKEAFEQQKQLEAHWAHLTIHGILHLLGYDHIVKTEAQVMEAIEIAILQQLGYNNPYEEQ